MSEDKKPLTAELLKDFLENTDLTPTEEEKLALEIIRFAEESSKRTNFDLTGKSLHDFFINSSRGV